MTPPMASIIAAAARRAAPREVCGLIVGAGEAGVRGPIAALATARGIPVTNIDQRDGRFALDPLGSAAAEVALRRKGERLLGYYHSHPHDDLAPSPDDHAGAVWPGAGPALRLIVARSGAWAAYVATGGGWQRAGAGQ